MKSKSNVKGFFTVQHLDKNGELKGSYRMPNGIVDEGMNLMLDVQFSSGGQETAWYIGLIDNAGFSSLAAGDTAAEIDGTNSWTELQTYTGTRQAWGAGSAAARAITNAATVDFRILGTVSINGIFVVTTATKGGTLGTMWSTASFSSAVAAVSGDTLKITYTVSG